MFKFSFLMPRFFLSGADVGGNSEEMMGSDIWRLLAPISQSLGFVDEYSSRILWL